MLGALSIAFAALMHTCVWAVIGREPEQWDAPTPFLRLSPPFLLRMGDVLQLFAVEIESAEPLVSLTTILY